VALPEPLENSHDAAGAPAGRADISEVGSQKLKDSCSVAPASLGLQFSLECDHHLQLRLGRPVRHTTHSCTRQHCHLAQQQPAIGALDRSLLPCPGSRSACGTSGTGDVRNVASTPFQRCASRLRKRWRRRLWSTRHLTDVVLIADPLVANLPVNEIGDDLVDVRKSALLRFESLKDTGDGGYAYLRRGLAERLQRAQVLLPHGYQVQVVGGYRPCALQEHYFTDFRKHWRR
jgi:hypothetical protein